MKNIENLLADLNELGIDTIPVLYTFLSEDGTIGSKEKYHLVHGYDDIQKYRTKDGFPTSSWDVSDVNNTATIKFPNNNIVYVDNFRTESFNIGDTTKVTIMGPSGSKETIYIPIETVRSLRFKERENRQVVRKDEISPAVILILLKLLSLRYDSSGDLSIGRSIERITEISEFLKNRLWTVFLPFASKVAATTIGLDLVSVIPMSSPKGIIGTIDYVYEKKITKPYGK